MRKTTLFSGVACALFDALVLVDLTADTLTNTVNFNLSVNTIEVTLQQTPATPNYNMTITGTVVAQNNGGATQITSTTGSTNNNVRWDGTYNTSATTGSFELKTESLNANAAGDHRVKETTASKYITVQLRKETTDAAPDFNATTVTPASGKAVWDSAGAGLSNQTYDVYSYYWFAQNALAGTVVDGESYHDTVTVTATAL